MIDINKKCWLIGEVSGGVPVIAGQFARLRGLEVRDSPSFDGLQATAKAGTSSLIAMSFAMFSQLSPGERDRIRVLVSGGATLYLRGGIETGRRYQLTPIVESSFSVGNSAEVASYRFTTQSMIPSALQGEQANLGVPVNSAFDMSGPALPLVIACHQDGSESPIVFTYLCGKGAIVCDVQAENGDIDSPIIWRLADPAQRCANISALIAVDRACERDASVPVPFNLTIDDIPLGYDYFNEAVLEDFMRHLEQRCAEVHLDCAWIPSSQRMSRRYVEILKSHRAGFVWHGMLRHVDHQKIEDPVAEMKAGKQAMERISRRYSVELQPVVIFPFERANRRSEELLLDEGFVAGVEQPRHDEGAETLPEYLRYATASCAHDSGLRFLHRYESKFLTIDRMLAIAALGMPILAFGHPKDVRLRRLSGLIDRGGTFSHFDPVLDFASSKSLRCQSLETIARETFNESSDTLMDLQCA